MIDEMSYTLSDAALVATGKDRCAQGTGYRAPL